MNTTKKTILGVIIGFLCLIISIGAIISLNIAFYWASNSPYITDDELIIHYIVNMLMFISLLSVLFLNPYFFVEEFKYQMLGVGALLFFISFISTIPCFSEYYPYIQGNELRNQFYIYLAIGRSLPFFCFVIEFFSALIFGGQSRSIHLESNKID